MVLSELGIAYLFLGGVGAGCLGACCASDLLFVKQPFGSPSYSQGPSPDPASRVLDYSFVIGFLMFATGCACLIFDIGRFDRLLSLFITPTLSWMSFGVYVLGVFFLACAFLVLIRMMYLPQFASAAVKLVEACVCAISLLVMFYTGLLLQGLHGGAIWSSAWLPWLFLSSSISGGLATMMMCSLFVTKDLRAYVLLGCLMKADSVVIIIEIFVVVGFLYSAALSSNPGTLASLESLVSGEDAILWWLGFVGCGAVLPLLAECALAFFGVVDNSIGPFAISIVGTVVLIGVLCLRIAVVDAADWRPLELNGSAQQQMLKEADLFQGAQIQQLSTSLVEGGHAYAKTLI